MTVAELNALLYSPPHARERLERALRVEALSPGWRSSFEALLQSPPTAAGAGNAGLLPAAAAHPVAPGFRPLAMTAIHPESTDVISLTMQTTDGGIAAHWKAPTYQSLLELAEACDVPVRWSCRTGVCHNCESGLVAGAVVYGPEPLDKPAEGNVLLCCAQPSRDIVVDL
jgi:ferredoxin